MNSIERRSLIYLALGTLCIIVAAVFGVHVYDDRLSALDAQTEHIDRVLAVPGNVSVCIYAERLASIYQAGVESRQRAEARYSDRADRNASERDRDNSQRLDALDKQIAALRRTHCQDIRTLVLDRQDAPVSLPSLP